MWNIISSNKILDVEWKKGRQLKHLTALRNMKPIIDTSSPNKYRFLQFKSKTKQLKKQKQQEIQNHNQLLVYRVLNKTSDIHKIGAKFFKGSLNSTLSKKTQREIDTSNVRLVKKLRNVKSQYSKDEIKKSLIEHQMAKTNIALQKMDPFYDFETVQNKKNIINSSRNRPFSAKH